MINGDANFDHAVRSALFSAAGELHADVAEIGTAQVTEADLRRALRRGIQAQLGLGIRVEVPAMPNDPGTSAFVFSLAQSKLALRRRRRRQRRSALTIATPRKPR
jgi:hypothetical protein